MKSDLFIEPYSFKWGLSKLGILFEKLLYLFSLVGNLNFRLVFA